jgi:hypothetical protein
VPPELSGERSEQPGVQGRVVWEAGAESRSLAIGVSGHWSAQQAAQDTQESWVGALDGDVRWGRIGLAGEAFLADRAAAFGAGVAQQARTRGGWMEVRVSPAERWQIVGGLGTDRLDSRAQALHPLRRNQTAFGSLTYRFLPELGVGVEYFQMRTSPTRGAQRRNHHVNGVLRYDF